MTACRVALVGNPNCGKTTLFNRLTGSNQRVGNWPGVTVEKKSGVFTHRNLDVEVIDLPGIYSATLTTATGALDERICVNYLLTDTIDIIVNIIDSANLERNLYLTTQLVELGLPIILAVNMVDIAKRRGIHIDLKKLEKKLGLPVIAMQCHKGEGVTEIKETIARLHQKPKTITLTKIIDLDPAIQVKITAFKDRLQQSSPQFANKENFIAMRLLEGDQNIFSLFDTSLADNLKCLTEKMGAGFEYDMDILIANARYTAINQLMLQVLTHQTQQKSMSQRIDKIVLNRFLGIPIFLSVMYLMFVFAINIGGAFQDFFDISSNTLFVQGLAHGLNALGVPAWFNAIIASGIGKGINTTITFAPVIAAMFFFLSLLEDSGYMSRAAFVIDRLMQYLGLPGKSFVPLIVGFGCNVPAVMGARTLEYERDRILTVMMSPFMSCGARLAIFAVFATAFFPNGGQNIVFLLYVLGMVCAVLTGLLLRKTILTGENSPLLMELPPYHLPRPKMILSQTWMRLKRFLFKAGLFIIPICVIIGALNSITVHGNLSLNDANAGSLLSTLGGVITPIFTPMGITLTNWPATVGLLTGVLAKEVVLATLNTLYTQTQWVALNQPFDLLAGFNAALHSIPENFLSLKDAFLNPFLASAPTQALDRSAMGEMYRQFGGVAGGIAYMIFILLYIPCVSTAAVTQRELGTGWMCLSLLWNTSLAYSLAVLFYQAATFGVHPRQATIYITAVIIYFCVVYLGMLWLARRQKKLRVTPELALTEKI